MLLTNHVMSGALLGSVIDEPWLLIPTGVASHLAMDAVPHFGFPDGEGRSAGFRDPAFIALGAADFAASIAVTVAVCVMRPERAGHIVIGAVSAAAPDLTYIPVIVFGQAWYRLLPWWKAMIHRFLAPIQWYEKPSGLVTEIAWGALMAYALGLVR